VQKKKTKETKIAIAVEVTTALLSSPVVLASCPTEAGIWVCVCVCACVCVCVCERERERESACVLIKWSSIGQLPDRCCYSYVPICVCVCVCVCVTWHRCMNMCGVGDMRRYSFVPI